MQGEGGSGAMMKSPAEIVMLEGCTLRMPMRTLTSEELASLRVGDSVFVRSAGSWSTFEITYGTIGKLSNNPNMYWTTDYELWTLLRKTGRLP